MGSSFVAVTTIFVGFRASVIFCVHRPTTVLSDAAENRRVVVNRDDDDADVNGDDVTTLRATATLLRGARRNACVRASVTTKAAIVARCIVRCERSALMIVMR